MTPPRGKPAAMKALAVLLYAMGNVSFGSIARLLGVSDVAVLNWSATKRARLRSRQPRLTWLSSRSMRCGILVSLR